MNPATLVARRLGCTEGQAYTVVIGVVIAVALAATGIPSVLRTRTAPAATTMPLTPAGDQAPPVPLASTPPVVSSAPTPPGVAAPIAPPSSAEATTPSASPPAPLTSVVTTPAAPPGTMMTFARVGSPGAPGGLAVGPSGTVFVTTDNGTRHGDRGPSHIFSFDAAGMQLADQTIAGQPDGHADGLAGAAVDPITGDVAVLDPDTARVLAVNIDASTQRLVGRIPDLPACLVSLGARPCEPGAQDHKPFPVSAAYDGQGNLFVADPGQDTIWRLRPHAAPEVWYQSTDFTTGDGPWGLALTSGSIDVTVGTSVDPAALDAGGLYRIAINPAGTAGSRTLVSAFARGDEPGPLTVGSSGTAYVALRQTGAIVAVTKTGSRSPAVTPPGKAPIPLDSPSALAMLPGQLLIANGGATSDRTHWAVLALSVTDGPAA